MFDKLKKIIEYIKKLSFSIDRYKEDSIVQSLPAKAIVNRAKKYIDKEDYAEAESILNEAVEFPQEDPLVYKYLGICAEKTGRFDDAMMAFKKSANINPQDKDIWCKLGFSQIQCKLFEDAEKAFENANKINPSNTDVFTGWGMALMKQKRYSDAHEKFVEATRLNKYNFMAMLLAAIMEMRLERYEDAELKLNFLSTVAPNDSNTYEYAHLKYIKKDYKNAEYYAKKSLEFNPMMLNPYLILARVYREQLDYKKMEETFKHAEIHNSKKPDLYYEWGLMEQYLEHYDSAKIMFEKVLELSPDEDYAKAGLGLTLAAAGELDAAEKLISEVMEKESDNYLAVKGSAIIAFKTGNYDKAIESFKYILQEDKTDYVCSYYIAKSYEILGNDILTKEYFENAIKDFPTFINSYIDFSKYLISKNEYAEAQRKLRKAVKIDEKNTEILNLLFYVSYILVKDNICEYNVKEVLSIADKINEIDAASFKYPEEKAELTEILKNL